MPDNYLDRSNYAKGLLLLIGKDKKITDAERKNLHSMAKTLDFNERFIANAIDELLENKYLGNEPPVFSQKHYAEAFLQDAIQLALVDSALSTEEFYWLHSIAVANGLSEEWLKNKLADYLIEKDSHKAPGFK